MAFFRGIQEYIALDANNITLVFDSGNIVNISGNIFLYPPQGHPILYNDFYLEIVNFQLPCGNISKSPSDEVNISQLISIARASTLFADFLIRRRLFRTNMEVKISLRQRKRVRERNFCVLTSSFIVFYHY